MYKTTNVTVQPSQTVQYWPSTSTLLNGGLNLIDKEFNLNNSQTPKVLNMWWKDGELAKRWGQEYIDDEENSESTAYASYKYLFSGYIIKHCGTKIYKQDVSTGAITSLYTVNASKGVFFKFNEMLYYKQSGKYIRITSDFYVANISDENVVGNYNPYTPTVIINRTPTGGGNANEEYNRLSASFKNSFNGNGSSTVYTLTDTELDDTRVQVTISGVSKSEGTHFTVNRTTGIVTFATAPASGTNNVIIQAYKTNQEDIDAILNSLYVIPFGGQNDNRLFIGGGNGGYYYWTGISSEGIDATYFAYNNYNIIGSTDEPITGFGKQFDTLCIFKEREIYGTTYTFNGTTGIFNTFPINSQIGCNCPDSIQNINNNLVWLNNYLGVCTMVGTAVQSQRKVFIISRNINPRLLTETTLTSASSVDFNGKYWLCVGDKVYLWDYFISPYVDTGNPDESAKSLSWWYFDTMNAQSWITDIVNLYHVDRASGKTVKFHTTYDRTQFYDFGNGISAIYRYPFREIGNGINEFTVSKGFIGISAETRSAYTVVYYTSDDPYGDPSTEEIIAGTFAWNNLSWALWTWAVMSIKYESVLLPLAKNVQYFGAEFSNSDSGRDMNISSIAWQYQITKLIK
jgi:hypothetical protein